MELRGQIHVPAALLSVAIAPLNSNSMNHSPSWETNSSSASQEIPHILRNPQVQCHTHKWPPSLPIQCNISLYQLDRKFGEPQNRSGAYERLNLIPSRNRHLQINVSISTYLSLGLRLCEYIYIYISVYQSMQLNLSACLSLYPSINIPVCLFIGLYVYHSTYPNLFLCLNLFICTSVFLLIHLSVH